MSDDIQFLKDLQTELKTQEQDSQADPRFWVIMDHEYQITEEGYHDRVSVFDQDVCESYEVEEYAKRLLEDGELSEDETSNLNSIINGDEYSKEEDLIDWIKDNCENASIFYEKEVSVIKQNTMFLTKQEAKNHLKANSHHYSSKAHIYAMTAWRAPKVERLMRILENFDWDSLKLGGMKEYGDREYCKERGLQKNGYKIVKEEGNK